MDGIHKTFHCNRDLNLSPSTPPQLPPPHSSVKTSAGVTIFTRNDVKSNIWAWNK